tara:strand:- start:1227 stop:2003 length:777 start_codon:yes stop_codon:yes gene_type:complete
MLDSFFYKAKYIIRLDDASHFSNFKKWDAIERILEKYDIKPIVAVIPKNMDNSIFYSKYRSDFWTIIKRWDTKGWNIAIHGYKHIFHYVERNKLIFPFYNRSEFAGLTLNEQRQKINKSNEIFLKNKINPKIWISPGHCMDNITLEAIKLETEIKIISDGISFYPYSFRGLHFIPQQLWKLKKKFFGIWTICLHPDTMSESEIKEFDKSLSLFVKKNDFLDLNKIDFTERTKSFFDKLFNLFFWIKYEIKVLFGHNIK